MAHASQQIHLLDICVRPCAYVKEVIEGSWKNLQDGAEKGFGHTLYGFKVYDSSSIQSPKADPVTDWARICLFFCNEILTLLLASVATESFDLNSTSVAQLIISESDNIS